MSALVPVAVLLAAVVLFWSAPYPLAVLPAPVVLFWSALNPLAVLPSAVVLFWSALAPIAVLLPPPVLLRSALNRNSAVVAADSIIHKRAEPTCGVVEAGSVALERVGSSRGKNTVTDSFLPVYVAVGDFNRDGKADLAVAGFTCVGQCSNSISVFLGNGDGTFQAIQNMVLADRLFTVVVGDFNGDGVPDLAVSGTYHIFALLGNGDGTFQAPRITFDSGAVAAGDFDGDGKLDLVSLANNNVDLLLGNGDGSFQGAGYFGVDNDPVWAAVGEFNGDGKPDIAVVNLLSNDISVLINTTPPRLVPRIGQVRQPTLASLAPFN